MHALVLSLALSLSLSAPPTEAASCVEWAGTIVKKGAVSTVFCGCVLTSLAGYYQYSGERNDRAEQTILSISEAPGRFEPESISPDVTVDQVDGGPSSVPWLLMGSGAVGSVYSGRRLLRRHVRPGTP
jgi:hypothetical protein